MQQRDQLGRLSCLEALALKLALLKAAARNMDRSPLDSVARRLVVAFALINAQRASRSSAREQA